MPIYEYGCQDCGHEFEEMQKFSDPPLELCPNCENRNARRRVSVSAFHLKGGGWYKDGYGNGSRDDKTEKSANTDATKSTDKTKSEAKSSESKTDEKKKSKDSKPSATSSAPPKTAAA